MKRVLTVIFLFFALSLSAFAQTGVSLIYINGSDINNPQIKKWYKKGIQKFHPYMKTAFEKNCFTRKCLLKNRQYFIEKCPVSFYWGDGCYNGLTQAKQSPFDGPVVKLAKFIRITAKNVLHDIIWVQKPENLNCVLCNLHKIVTAELQKCNKVVLFGYSSGSIIAYEYLLARSPDINVAELINCVNITKEQRKFALEHPMKDTCMSALQNLGTFSSDGHLTIDTDLNSFKKNYLNLDAQTNAVCIPENSVIGVVNIASPLVLFHSDISSPDFELTYYNRFLYKYILEHDMFWLTVNYREDPMSFPVGKNLELSELEFFTGLNITPCGGFIYDKSDTTGGIRAMAHMSYLATSKSLSKKIAKTYVEGHNFQYCHACRHSSCKCRRKINVRP